MSHEIYTDGVLNPLATSILQSLLLDLCPACEPPAVAAKWDAASKGADITLSNEDLTASTTQYSNFANVRSTTSHNSGKHCAKIPIVYTADPSMWEVLAGFCTPDFDTTSTTESGALSPNAWALGPDGGAALAGVQAPMSLPVASGGAVFAYYDAGTGDVSFANDPEATPTLLCTLTPGTELFLLGSMCSCNEPSPVSATIDPPYSGHGYAAW